MNTCPDFSLLSQFLDHELGREEEEPIRHHLAACPECQAQVGRAARAEGMVRAVLTSPLPPSHRRASPQECLSPEVVSAYVHQVLSTAEKTRVEQHLHACDVCLSEVKEAVFISSALTIPNRAPVPAALKARVASLWESPPAAAKILSLSRLVIQLAQKGLRLVEQHLTAPLLEVQELLTPLPAYRAGEDLSALNLRINAGQAEIRTTAVQEGERVALSITLLGVGQEGLAGQRVFLRQQGRAIFSARTDQEGGLRLPRLEPGVYEVACPGIQATFQLELRSGE